VKLRSLFAQAVGATIVLAADEPAHARDASVTHQEVIEGLKFVPEALNVKLGDTIEWVNKGFFPHTATARKGFDSGEIKANSSWRYVAGERGTISYICTYHPTMKGLLTVE
jgi:plastocyanin